MWLPPRSRKVKLLNFLRCILINILIMYPDPLNLALLLLLCAGLRVDAAAIDDAPEIRSVRGADCTLTCGAEDKAGVEYRALRWYKVREPPMSRLSGLLTRDLPNGTTRWYTGLDREVELLGESRSIFLPNVTCSDSGVYICHLAAPVGEQNREGQVRLTLTDCDDQLTEELITDASLVICATAVLMVALVIFLISYGSLKNILQDRSKTTTKKETLLDARLKPLEKKDLMLIYTLGPKPVTMKHICV
ncbi:CD83 antigen [Xiphias gladius]|uniref:CD83 antigen n=1 Tax=Xiphias gladius TaxID=8245 RepID=UPI001A99DED4|nr:CD83 antigen [Xiphias gladius]